MERAESPRFCPEGAAGTAGPGSEGKHTSVGGKTQLTRGGGEVLGTGKERATEEPPACIP